ncbi:MAG: glycosyltransferase [Muribaculaceae bacterium]|nr:glycosyltransferase [Muribaculaceae bacterium]
MISVVFVSNFLIHHQYPFCREMLKCTEINFTFVCCNPLSEERKNLGYEDYSNLPFVVRTYDGPDSMQKALTLTAEADVAIIGHADDEFIRIRMSQNKLTFKYCERLFKRGKWVLLHPAAQKSLYQTFTKYRKKNLYILAASAFSMPDLRLCGFNPNKGFKFGYLPEVIRYDDIDSLMNQKEPASIIWVGRFLDWKHPDFALKAAKVLWDEGLRFSMKLIGIGPVKEECEEYVRTNLPDCDIKFLGAMNSEDVRRNMEKSTIHLFTSDRREGWGAVLGEGMNSGCAVIASDACGSTPYLVEQNVNGLIFRSGDFKGFCNLLRDLISDPSHSASLGKEAYYTMTTLWNAEVAAPRFVNLCKALLNGEPIPQYPSGVCSKG